MTDGVEFLHAFIGGRNQVELMPIITLEAMVLLVRDGGRSVEERVIG